MKHIIQYDNRYHHHHHCPCRTALSSWFSSPCWQCPPPLNRKCHDRQFFWSISGITSFVLVNFHVIDLEKIWDLFWSTSVRFFKYLTGWNGISIPTRTDTSNLQGGQRTKASMRGFSVMLGEHEKLPPSAAKWPSMPRMIDTGRCKKGDSSVRTMWSRASIFRSTTISRCLWPSSH